MHFYRLSKSAGFCRGNGEVNVQIIKEDKTYNDGDNVPLSVVVSNAGSNKINNVCINYLLPEELEKANTALKSQDLGSIESHKEAKTDIIIKSDKKQIQEDEASSSPTSTSSVPENKDQNITGTFDKSNLIYIVFISMSMALLMYCFFVKNKNSKKILSIFLVISLAGVFGNGISVRAAEIYTIEESTVINIGGNDKTIKVIVTYEKEADSNKQEDIGLETPWVYDSNTKRHKTMYDGTVIYEELFDSNEGNFKETINPETGEVIREEIPNDGKGLKIWGWYDKQAAMDIVNEIGKMQSQNNIYPYTWDENLYEDAKRSAAIYACTRNSSAIVHMSSGALPNVLDNRKYITFGINTYEGEGIAVACFVCDSSRLGDSEYYGERTLELIIHHSNKKRNCLSFFKTVL